MIFSGTDSEKTTSSFKIGYELLSLVIQPNIVYNQAETEKRKQEAINSVPQTHGFILEGDIIVRKNEFITPEIQQKLISLESAWNEKRIKQGGIQIIYPYIGRLLFAASCLIFLFAYLFYYGQSILQNVRHLSLVTGLILLQVIFHYVFVQQLELPVVIVPVVLIALLLTTLFDVKLGFAVSISTSLILAGMEGYEFTTGFIFLFVCSVTCITVANFRKRTHVFTSIFWVAISYLFIILTIALVKFREIPETFAEQIPYALSSGILSMLLGFGCLVIFENVFDICTNFTLLELSDSNHPLQEQMALKAPGTYHHSIIVSNLCKAAAEAVGANSMLVRVGALYHDIGKIEIAEYFVENQLRGINKHDNLNARMSALILTSHIKIGLELAQKHRLPKILQSYIPEHHGSQLMVFFYHKALENKEPDEIVDELDFRYPGPRPHTKESGILMLADGVEAATRSIKEPTATRIRSMVESIIENRLYDGELDDCDLTIKDLKKIAEAFIPILLGIYKERVEYPGQEQMVSAQEKLAAKA